MRRCRHFDGIGGFDNKKCCRAGVNYRQIVGGDDFGWACRLPCRLPCRVSVKDEPAVTCEKYEAMTDADLAAEKADREKLIADMEKMMPWLDGLKRTEKPGASGIDVCPVCGCRIHWSIAECNGHVHAQCETPDCVAFME
jgi:hypothetical protein